MMQTGADLLLQTIHQLDQGKLEETDQSSASPSNEVLHQAPKIFTETCEIKWDKNVEEVYNLIRGLSPYPTAFTFLNGKKLKIFKAEKELDNKVLKPGEMITDHKSFLKFSANDGFISLKEIQLEGKKKMPVEDFLRGWRN
jgi:methionyl-tRNA formyltransferase